MVTLAGAHVTRRWYHEGVPYLTGKNRLLPSLTYSLRASKLRLVDVLVLEVVEGVRVDLVLDPRLLRLAPLLLAQPLLLLFAQPLFLRRV